MVGCLPSQAQNENKHNPSFLHFHVGGIIAATTARDAALDANGGLAQVLDTKPDHKAGNDAKDEVQH